MITAMVVDGGRVYLATKNSRLASGRPLDQTAYSLAELAVTMPRTLPGDALLCLAQDPLQYNYLWIGTFGEGPVPTR